MGRRGSKKGSATNGSKGAEEAGSLLFPGFQGEVPEQPAAAGEEDAPVADPLDPDRVAEAADVIKEANTQKAEDDRVAAEAAAKVEEERAAAEAVAKAEEDRLAAEAAAKAEADREAAEAAAKADEDRAGAEAAAMAAETDRLAAESAAKDEEVRLAAEAAAKAEADRVAAEAAAKAETNRLAAEAAAKDEEVRLASEAAAKGEADRLAAEAAAKAETDRLAAEAAAKAEKDREAAEAAAKANEDRAAPEAAEAATTPSNGNAETTLWAAAEKRLRELLPGVKDTSVLQELANLSDSDALERLVQKGKPPPKANFAPRASFVKNNPFAANESMAKSQASQEAAKGLTKNLGTVDSKSLAVGGAGQGGGLGLNKPGFGPKVQHFAGRGSITGAKSIAIDEAVPFAWSEMLDDKSSVDWVITSYSADGKQLALDGKGEGGLTAFKARLPEGIAWGGFRCYGVDKRGGLECKRPKFIFVCYKPEASSAIKKAKQASHKGDVKEAFPGAHLDVTVETMDDLNEQSLITKLQAATGAHKPNGYEFTEGTFLEADFYGLGIGKNCSGESSKN